MEAIILRCPMNGRFHFGLTGLDENAALYQSAETLHSDTLFSALVHTCLKVFPSEVDEFVKWLSEDFRFSSASFCLEISKNEVLNQRIFFLPKPTHFDSLNPNPGERKQLKKIKYLSKKIWEAGITPLDENWSDVLIIGGKFAVLSDEISSTKLLEKIDGVYTVETAPKIADHARKKLNNIFFQTDLHLHTTVYEKQSSRSKNEKEGDKFQLSPHFYFLVNKEQVKENEPKSLQWLNRFDLLIDILADEGIGGAISTGSGQLAGIDRIDNFSLQIPKEKIHQEVEVSMSLIAPEESDQILFGDLMVRGGRPTAFTPTPLQRIKMVREGALIGSSTQGRVVDISPKQGSPNPYLRYGKAFGIPIHQNFYAHD